MNNIRSSSRTMNHFNSPSFNESPKKTNRNNYSESDTDNEIEDFINKNFGKNINDSDDDNNRFENQRFDKNDSDFNNSINITDQKRGPKLYFIQQQNKNIDDNFKRDRRSRIESYRDEKEADLSEKESELPTTKTKSSHKRSNSLVRSGQFLLQKSKSIINLFQSEEKKNLSNSSSNISSTKLSKNSSSKNEKLQKSNTYKSPFAWNIDWNLYPLPYLHIK